VRWVFKSRIFPFFESGSRPGTSCLHHNDNASNHQGGGSHKAVCIFDIKYVLPH